MPPPGGLSAKIGNRYEGRIAIGRILQLLDEQHDSVKVCFEKPGMTISTGGCRDKTVLAPIRMSSGSSRWTTSGRSGRWSPAV